MFGSDTWETLFVVSGILNVTSHKGTGDHARPA
jgi:hypothetical protein